MNYDSLVDKFLSKKILFVTSFNKKIYDFTGINLIASFNTYCQDDNIDILVAYENFNFKNNNKNIISENVMTEFLTNILQENSDIIPTCYGGKANVINNPELYNTKKKYNFQASRWFRKLAALEIAYIKYRDKYEYIIWIDSDCLFLKDFNYNDLIIPLNNKILGYYYGCKRLMKNHGIETGLVFFQKTAYNILYDWFNLISNKEFRKVERWDDGYLLKYLLIDKKYPNNDKFIDFAEDIVRLNPIDYGPYTSIIKHMKGIHQNNNIVYIKN